MSDESPWTNAPGSLGQDSSGPDVLGRDAFGRDAFGRDQFGYDQFGRDRFGRDRAGRDRYGNGGWTPRGPVGIVIAVVALIAAVVIVGSIIASSSSSSSDNLDAADQSEFPVYDPGITAPPSPSLDVPIPNHDAEMVAVAAVAQQLFGSTTQPANWAALVDDSNGLESAMFELFSNSCRPGAAYHPATITFSSVDRAHLTFSFTGPNIPGGQIGQEADAVKVAGTWRITAQSLTAMAALASNGCR